MDDTKLFAKYIIIGKNKLPQRREKLLTWAENNRVLYSLGQDPSMKSIRFQGREWIKKLGSTLAEIKITLGAKEYLVTRTYKYIDYVTFDVDLFVGNQHFNRVVDKFEARGFSIESHDNSLGGRLPGMQVNIKKAGLLTIDLHQDFTWQKRQFLEPKSVMRNPKERKIAGISVLTPSPEVELLLCIADIAHERFSITLLDLIWLKGLSKEIRDWNFVFNQAKKYKWLNVFKKVSSIVNQIALDIYGQTIVGNVSPKKGFYQLPYFLSLPTCWMIYINTLLGYSHFPVVSFLYMHYNQFKYLIKNQMPYYSPWFKL